MGAKVCRLGRFGKRSPAKSPEAWRTRDGGEGEERPGAMQAEGRGRGWGTQFRQGWVEGEEQGWWHWGPASHLLPASTARLRVGGAEAVLSWKRNEWE